MCEGSVVSPDLRYGQSPDAGVRLRHGALLKGLLEAFHAGGEDGTGSLHPTLRKNAKDVAREICYLVQSEGSGIPATNGMRVYEWGNQIC
jgi:hypothetical protein